MGDAELWIQGGALALLGLVLAGLAKGSKEVWTTLKSAIGAGLVRFNQSADRFDQTMAKLTETAAAGNVALERRHHEGQVLLLRHLQAFERRLVAEFRREVLEERACSECEETFYVLQGSPGAAAPVCDACAEERKGRS